MLAATPRPRSRASLTIVVFTRFYHPPNTPLVRHSRTTRLEIRFNFPLTLQRRSSQRQHLDHEARQRIRQHAPQLEIERGDHCDAGLEKQEVHEGV